eukprot:364701-Chlamydomonas_euryale.AAC.5
MFGVTEWEWKLSDLDGEQRWPALRRVLFGLLAASTLSQARTTCCLCGRATYAHRVVLLLASTLSQANLPRGSLAAHSHVARVEAAIGIARVPPHFPHNHVCLPGTTPQMARVDMAIGIIPIAAQMGWDQGTAGIVQSAFFQLRWGGTRAQPASSSPPSSRCGHGIWYECGSDGVGPGHSRHRPVRLLPGVNMTYGMNAAQMGCDPSTAGAVQSAIFQV